MSNYSYSEIQDMQRKAMERVREMKRNSDIVTQSAQRDFDVTDRNYSATKEVTPKITNMPPNFPKETAYPSFKTVFENEREKILPETKQNKQVFKSEKENTLEGLFKEPDRALLLGLIMLLKSEKADEGLILALTYILS